MKYVIFDMDGVIVDTEPEYRRRTKSFFESMGYQIPEELYDLTCGSNLKHTYELFRKYVKEFDMEYEEYVEKRKHYGNYEAIDPGKYVDKHIYPLLDWLKRRKIHIALASSSPRESIERYLTLLKIREYFELIVSGAEFKNSKPDPEIYRYTIKKLHATAAECLVVEDSIYGIIAAKQAGAVIAAKKDERFGQDQSGADYMVDDLLQIEGIIEGENQ